MEHSLDEEADIRPSSAATSSSAEFHGSLWGARAPEEAVRAAILEAMTPFRLSDGSYRLEQEWHFLIASV